MSTNTIDGDLRVKGRVLAETISVDSPAWDDGDIAANAAIDAGKLDHEHRPTISQEATANAVAGTYIVHTARAAGSIEAFECGLVTPPDTASGSGGRTAIFDLKKNGTTVLSGPVTLNSTNTAYIVAAGSLSVLSYVDGDVITVAITLGAGSTGTHAKGVFASVTLREAAA